MLLIVLAAVLVPGIALGEEASGFAGQGLSVTAMDGKKVPLDTLLARGPVVINFWATWCGPCRVELPQLQKVCQEMQGKKVAFAAVSLDRGMKREVLESFLQGRSITALPVYRDETSALAKIFRVTAIPATFVLSPGGEVVFQTKGYRPGDEILLKKKIEEAIASAEKAAEAKTQKD